MRVETMRPLERLEAAFRLEKPDRVPVVPLTDVDIVTRWLGRPQSDWVKDWSWVLPAIVDHFDAFGQWDAPFNATAWPPIAYSISAPMKLKRPGIELPDHYPQQFDEQPMLQPEDYVTISEIGWTNFWRSDFVFRIRDIEPSELPAQEAWLASLGPAAIATWRQRGIEPLVGGGFCHPFFVLSQARSLVKFTEDLYYIPNQVEAALRTMVPETIEGILSTVKTTGIPRVQIIEERASAYYYPPRIFERLWWPYTQQIVDAIWSEGIFSVWHLDSPWDRNLPYFKQLPRGSICLELDSTTDIFLAKEILGDHLSIMGDVPATLLAIGTPEDVRQYCTKLIDRIGYNGGFVLSSGCVVPIECRPENFQAMIDTGKTYELSR
jgi:hypothetical protein